MPDEPKSIKGSVDITPLHELVIQLGQGGHAGEAIIAAAQIENVLQRLIVDRMPNLSPTLRTRLFKGPLFAFAWKIDVAYALGQIDDTLRHDLQVLKDIRNLYAHSPKRLHFGSPEVRSLLDEFKHPDRQVDPYAFFIKKIDGFWDAINAKLRTTTLAYLLQHHHPFKDGFKDDVQS